MTKNEKISQSMLNNNNAEKWTFELAEKLLLDAIDLSNKKETFTVNGNKIKGYSFDFIGEVARELNTFHQNLTIHLPEKFPKLRPLSNKLHHNIEANCFYNTKRGIIKEATGIVNLKSNYKWTDRQQIEIPSIESVQFKVIK